MSDRERSQTPLDHKGSMNDRDRSPQGRRDDSPGRNHKVVKSYSRSPSQGRSRKMSYRGGGGDSGGGGRRGEDRERDRDRDNRGGDNSSSRRYRSRSRSRSEKRYKSSRYSLSRSRSHSRGKGYSRRDRSLSHSPMSSRRRHVGTRDNPTPSRCLGVFGLSVYTSQEDLYDIFSKYGPVEHVQVVIDAKSGRSRGFAFVYFESTEDAKVAKEQCSGLKINGKSIRVDYSITERAHTPTPGIYMGKPTYTSSDRWSDRRGGGGGGGRDRDDYYGGYRGSRHRRSPSPYYRRRSRYDRSRSRSYSPRRY